MAGEGAERLAETVRELASIVASSHDAILGVAGTGTITSCNAAGARLYGYPPEELVGQPVEILVPDGLRAAEAVVLRRILAGEEVDPYRTSRVHQDGTVVTVWVTVSPILDADGAVVGAATVSRRVGDVQEAGERLRSRVSRQRADVRAAEDRFQAGMAAHRARERQRVETAQRRFEAEMDLERAQERIRVEETGDRFQARMVAERAKEQMQVQEAEDRFQAGLEAERGRKRTEVEEAEDRFQAGLAADRAQERVELQDAEDRFLTGLDAERAEAQSDRAWLQSQLQQGQRLEILGQLAGGVAHDFNNLLAVILNYAVFVTEELRAGPEADVAAAARDVAQIQRAAERAAALTHQLLAFARREIVRPRVLDLNDVVIDVEELLRRTIGEDVLLRTELATDIWPVLMDPGQVEQVLMNVAVNARDAMAEGGTLGIETANVEVDAAPLAERYVRLRISDTGKGMSAEVLDRVFEPFFTTKAEGMGTGLGLATVYGIVTQAGGSITVRSRPGVGTTLTILIPVTADVVDPVEEVPAVHHRGTGETVLLVEDEEALRAVAERILTGGGYRVLLAVDGVEAVALADGHDGEISLLITDVVMPKMLGNEVASRIRAIRPELQVLFMSGYAQHELAARSGIDGDVHLIEKPFTAEALLDQAGRILDRARGTAATVPPTAPADDAVAARPDPARDRT